MGSKERFEGSGKSQRRGIGDKSGRLTILRVYSESTIKDY